MHTSKIVLIQGELLATFEMFELGTELDKIPDLPNFKEEISDFGPILPVPPHIRPKLVKYRFEVLFWGLRDLKKIQFLPVNHPRVDIECGGHVIQVRDDIDTSSLPTIRIIKELHDHERKEESQLPPDGEVPGPGAARAGDLLSPPHHQGPRL